MSRRLTRANGTYRFQNDFQRDFAFQSDQLDAVTALLADVLHNDIPTDERSMSAPKPYLASHDVEVYGAPARQNARCWIRNTRNGDAMYVRNQQHAKGLLKEVEPLASDPIDRPTTEELEEVPA